MGIDNHTLHLLKYVKRNYGPLGSTVTLGRQALHLGPSARKHWAPERTQVGEVFCDQLLLDHFGASEIDSIDNSSYEGATIVADLNCVLPKTLENRYDSVLDFGCSEHIFDVATSFRNMTHMCKPGGRILHVVPANGYCGHGFFQFSPELFFSYYSTNNGYKNTEVFLANLLDPFHWYRVLPPKNGNRVNIRSSTETLMIALTTYVACAQASIQQSDYIHSWEQKQDTSAEITQKKSFFSYVRKRLLETRMAPFANAVDSAFSRTSAKTLNRHPSLTKVRADSL